MATLLKRNLTWCLVYRDNGKQVWKSLKTGDKRRAEVKAGEILKESEAIRQGAPLDTIEWAVFRDKYLAHREKIVNHFTMATDLRAIRNLEIARPNIRRIKDLNPDILATLSKEWEAKRPAPVVEREIRAIKTAVRKAEEWYNLPAQRWDKVKGPRLSKGRLNWWNAEEVKSILEVCHGPWKTAALLAARCGLRLGEVHNLPWKHIDLKGNRVFIGSNNGWQTKTGSSQRWIPMPNDLHDHLADISRRDHGEYVLSQDGDRMALGSFTTYFKRLVKKAKMKGSFHTLRHSYASHLANSGVPLKVVAELLGHSSIKMTEIYSHMSDESKKDAVQKLPEIR